MDPLFDEKSKRSSILPIVYPEIWSFYIKHKGSYWVEGEIPYRDDLDDWNNKLDDDERYFIKLMLAYFSPSDMIVNESESKNEGEISIPEVQFYIRNKMEREDTHSLTYANHLETLVPDKEERIKLINSVETIPVIKDKAEWFRRYINNGNKYERIIATAITEGIFFSSSFCSIFWLKKRGLMPALTYSNELISKDEGNHRDFYCLLIRLFLDGRVSREQIIEMITSAVRLEVNFASVSLPVKLLGMNIDLMTKYIEYVADHLALNLIGERIYKGENPFEWMDMISMDIKTNFFEKRVGAYSDVVALSSKEENEIRFDAQF